jgi:hypothetical protein
MTSIPILDTFNAWLWTQTDEYIKTVLRLPNILVSITPNSPVTPLLFGLFAGGISWTLQSNDFKFVEAEGTVSGWNFGANWGSSRVIDDPMCVPVNPCSPIVFTARVKNTFSLVNIQEGNKHGSGQYDILPVGTATVNLISGPGILDILNTAPVSAVDKFCKSKPNDPLCNTLAPTASPIASPTSGPIASPTSGPTSGGGKMVVPVVISLIFIVLTATFVFVIWHYNRGRGLPKGVTRKGVV